jgi:hypothetical protein
MTVETPKELGAHKHVEANEPRPHPKGPLYRCRDCGMCANADMARAPCNPPGRTKIWWLTD